jgi:hypothetical protein
LIAFGAALASPATPIPSIPDFPTFATTGLAAAALCWAIEGPFGADALATGFGAFIAAATFFPKFCIPAESVLLKILLPPITSPSLLYLVSAGFEAGVLLILEDTLLRLFTHPNGEAGCDFPLAIILFV